MNKETRAKSLRWLLLSAVFLGLAATLIILPKQFQTEAGSQRKAGKGLIERTVSHEKGIENYDIREQKSEDALDALTRFRDASGKTASAIADVNDKFVRGEEELKARVPSLTVEYNRGVKAPEVISPDVWKTEIERLTGPSSTKNAEILRNFARQNNQLIGMEPGQLDSLRIVADYTNPAGNMAFASLLQDINGVTVFAGELKAGFTTKGEIVRVINNLAPGLDYGSLSTDFRDPLDAVKSAFRNINKEPTKLDVEINSAASTDLKTVFGNGDWATTAEKMYFPTEPGVARPAWRVLIWQRVNAYYVIVDAETGTMLWRKNITEDQVARATYQVYGNALAYMDSADSPAPLTPGPLSPLPGTQGPIIPERSTRTLVGNEPPNWGMNDLGWMTDGTNFTDGNNVEAGIDRDEIDGVDAPQAGNGTCPGAQCRVFTSLWNPPPGNSPPGDDPLITRAQRGAVIQMFYAMNLYHDLLYNLGMNEQAFNFQTNNFGRGGVGNDRVSAEGQDSSGTNNANFATPADGGRGRMQMFLWTGPTPHYDGTTDIDVVIHEVTHGTSNRLHGNTAGLTNNMSRGMGEGWSDWYGHTMLAEPSDPINGIYTMGGYVSYLRTSATDTSNYYYGIRRFPKAVIAFTGGPGNLPHNPLTFANLNVDNCATFNGAFRPGLVGSTTCDQVHNAGEIWSSALWEVRALMVTRLMFGPGTKRVLQVVTDGMKLAPISPTFLQERDAIIAAASALPAIPEASADVADVREGFRRRGMGFSASIQGISPAEVTEAFDVPNVQTVVPFSVSDAPGNGNGFPEPGERVRLSVAVTNTTGGTINNVQVNINGGANTAYGSINAGQTVTMQLPYSIPGVAGCGSIHPVNINVSSAAGMRAPVARSIRLGVPSFSGSTQNFDGITAPALPASWENIQLIGSDINWTTSTTTPNSAPNHAFANNPDTLNDAVLLAGAQITSAAAQLSFKNWYHTEHLFDGVVVEYSTDGNTWTDVCPSCATICPGASCPFVSGGYDTTILTGFSNPLGGRRAWSGTVGAYRDTVINLPAALNGQIISLRWRMASDTAIASIGVRVDDVVLTGGNFRSGFACSVAVDRKRADFDGDGKTDLSVFRPTEGNWYIKGSTAGFSVTNWGLGSDKLVPGDYDGDGKTDTAVFRPVDAPGTPDFFILNSNGFTVSAPEWGVTGDVPVISDYDSDGRTDVAVYRPSSGTWYVLKSAGGITVQPYGLAGDIPVAGNFAGDAASDLTVFRPTNRTWYTRLLGGASQIITFGSETDMLVPADYDGDGMDDLAVFRPSNGTWFILNSSVGTVSITQWGLGTDIPVPGEYDGDGKYDIAVYRNGAWWVRNSGSGMIAVNSFGVAADNAIPRNYLPQ